MAKHPVPGRVKTRLAAALGADAACALYRAFVLDLAERLAALPYAVTWAYTPPDAPFPELLPGAGCRPQRGRDLGERLTGAIGEEFAAGPGPVVAIGADAPHIPAAALAEELAAGPAPVLAIGADAPHIPAAALAEGAAALTHGADVVLGPAADGGYYLIGLRGPAPGLFAGIAWGTAGVLEATLARAAAAGLAVHLLSPSFDVDQVADLSRLRALLARDDVSLPRTAGVLAGFAAVLDTLSRPGGNSG